MMLILRFTSRYLIPTCHLISDALRFHDILDPARGKPITITKCFHQSAILYRHWSPENVAEYRMFIFCVFHPSHRPIYRIVCAHCEHKWIYSDIRHRQFRTRNMAFHGNHFCIFVRGIKNLPQQHGYYILISCFFANFFFVEVISINSISLSLSQSLHVDCVRLCIAYTFENSQVARSCPAACLQQYRLTRHSTTTRTTGHGTKQTHANEK